MFTRTLRPLHDVVVINKQFVRTVTVSSEAVTTSDNNLKSWKEIPGPSSLPLIGQLLHHLPGGSLYNLNGRKLSKKLYNTYGPIVRFDAIIGMKPLVFLFDPECCEQILRGENKLPERPGFNSLEYYRRKIKDTKPGEITGLLTDQGEPWKQFRSTINPVMLQPKTIKLYAQALDEVASDMVERIKRLRDENVLNKTFDQEMNLWSLESISVIALGSRIGCFKPNLSDDDPVKRLIRCIHEMFALLEELDFRPNIWKYVATPKYKKCMKLFEEHEDLCRYFINKAKRNFKKNPTNDDEMSILEKLLAIDERIANLIASDMLFAGVDTTANTVTAALYLLAINQDKQNKLREELTSDPKSKSYLKACFKESLRMMPVVSGNARITTKEYNVLGYKLPANLQIIFMHEEMALMENNFSRPNEFIPERWLVDKTDPLYYRNAHPFAYNPFGFGVRSCVGRRIAETETETLVAKAVENFNIEWNGPPPNIKQTTLNYIKGPFHFIFNDIKK